MLNLALVVDIQWLESMWPKYLDSASSCCRYVELYEHWHFETGIQEANKPPDGWFDLKVNTHVYVTGLPDDVTAAEVSDDHNLNLNHYISLGKSIFSFHFPTYDHF